MSLSYTPKTWVEKETKIHAEDMTRIEQGIKKVTEAVNELPDTAELTIGTVSSGESAAASIEGGKLNLTLPRGEKGDAGPAGAQGPKGDKGDTGEQGPSGAAGPAGAKGDKGDTGPAGAAGPKGETGAQGPKGDKGDTGPQGEGISATARSLMLQLFEGAAYGNSTMQSTLEALRSEWGSSGGETTVAVSSVSLNKSVLTLTEGSSETLTATVLPSNATDKTVTWTVSPSGYATVSGGSLTAIKAGSCTVTATAGGKSASCAVTVNAAEQEVKNTNPFPDVEAAYLLPTAKTFTPAAAEYIDTGVKLFDVIDPKPSFTILIEVKGGANLQAKTDTHDLLHCMEEISPWPGMCVQVSGADLQVCAYKSSGKLTTVAEVKAAKKRMAIRVSSGNLIAWRPASEYSADWGSISGMDTTVDKTLILGAYQTSNGTKGRFFDGTLYQCVVYKSALTDEQLKSWVNAEVSE